MPTAGLTLRPISVDDLDALYHLDQDPEVMRYVSDGRPTPRSLLAEVLLPRMLAAAGRQGVGYFAIERADLGLVGWAHLRPDILEPTWLELGYRLQRPLWGLGIATWAARALIRRAFDDLGVDVVSARTVPEHLASRRVMERAGLGFAGDFTFPARAHAGLALPAVPGVLHTRRRDDPGRDAR